MHGFHVDTPRLPSLPDATWKHFVHVTRTPRHHDHQGAASTCAHDDNLNALVYAAPQFAPELPLFLQRLTRMLPGMPLMGAVADGSPRGVQHTGVVVEVWCIHHIQYHVHCTHMLLPPVFPSTNNAVFGQHCIQPRCCRGAAPWAPHSQPPALGRCTTQCTSSSATRAIHTACTTWAHK